MQRKTNFPYRTFPNDPLASKLTQRMEVEREPHWVVGE